MKKRGRPEANWDGRLEEMLVYLQYPKTKKALSGFLGWNERKVTEVLAYGRIQGKVRSISRGPGAEWSKC